MPADGRRTQEAYKKQFDIGRRTLLDLLDGENEPFLSSQDLINARFDRDFAAYRILAAMDELIEMLNAELPPEARPSETPEMKTVGHGGIADSEFKKAAIEDRMTVREWGATASLAESSDRAGNPARFQHLGNSIVEADSSSQLLGGERDGVLRRRDVLDADIQSTGGL